eukprot:comp21149_c0_seq1/m.28618 comp21149_c0_seq1/g.28618  ORF comp21149_c0_seq1/g.28618 comp21149_c0_seq1/m.28618 type:complete len:316 (-) comp21149_c0_seq1:646-1593(-)
MDKELLKGVWDKVKCGELVAGQKIVSIDSEASVEDACEVLSKNKILSAPIWSEKYQSYIGLFDVADMIAFLLTVFQNATADRKADLRTLVQEGLRNMPVPVKWVADLSLRNPVKLVSEDDGLGVAVNLFAQGVHRVCVAGPDGKIKGILTQSGAAKWLENNELKTVDPLVSKTLTELGMVSHQVHSVDSNDNVLQALELMHKKGVSSVAMLNSDKQLIGSISLSDIKYIFHSLEFEWLWRSAHDFMSAVRIDQAFEHEGKDAAPVFGVRATATLSFAMRKMRATKAHRVWIVSDDGNVPIGVVSLTDVMKKLNPM